MGQFYLKKTQPEAGLGYYSKLDQKDILDRIAPVISRGMFHVTTKHTIRRAFPDAVGWDTPWDHAYSMPNFRCNLWHFIMFNCYGWFVPSKCQDCWKVVVTPRNLSELFKLRDLQIELGYPAKCGIEAREYTPKLYGGYFYNKGPEEGLNKYKIVREAVSDKISPDIGVILKRACTEYEMQIGPSDKWQVSRQQKYIEDILEDRFEDYPGEVRQPDYVKTHVHRAWIHWAYAAGDSTFAEYTDGKNLYPDYMKYHEMSLDEIKNLLAANRVKAIGMGQEKAKGLSEKVVDAAQKTESSREELAAVLGFKDPIIIGEHDELN